MAAVDTWLTPAAVIAHAPGADAAKVEPYRAAAAAYVERVRPELFREVSTAVGPDVQLGAAMLAARWLARQGSPSGLASFGEFGPAAVLRLDPDVERLLGVGRHARPVAR